MKNNNFGRKRTNIFVPFRGLYKKIREDEERKQKSVLFGLISILFSVLCVALVYPCVYWGIQGVIFAFSHNFGIFTYMLGLGNIVIVFASVGAMVLPYDLWFQSILLVIWQFRLNKRFIRWFALIIWVASIVGIVWLTSVSLDLILNPMLNG